jgi:hypothetical protein
MASNSNSTAQNSRFPSLDIAAPDDLPAVLESAAELYRESIGELASAWQDDSAGKVWGDLANILDRAAASARRAIAKRFKS